MPNPIFWRILVVISDTYKVNKFMLKLKCGDVIKAFKLQAVRKVMHTLSVCFDKIHSQNYIHDTILFLSCF